MISTRLIHRLAFGIWALEPVRAQAFMPLVSKLLVGAPVQNEELMPERKGWFEPDYTPDQIAALNGIKFIGEDGASVDPFATTFGPEVRNLVAVLPLQDVILKNDEYCGPRGMSTVVGWLEKYSYDPRVSAMLLDADSPGGEGTGMTLMVDALDKAMQRKPVVTIVRSGMAASAMYGIAAKTDMVFASRETDEFGSIGTYVTLLDWKAKLEAEGLPVHEIYATASTEKNKDFLLALDGKYERLRKNYIDPFNTYFMNLVMQERDLKDDGEVLKGRLYYADEAIKLGLVDGYETLEGAADAARKRNPEYEQQTTTKTTKTMFGTKKNVNVTAIAGKAANDLTPEELNAVDADLKKEGVAAFLVPTSEKVSSASELSAMVDNLTSNKTDAETKATAAKTALESEKKAREAAEKRATDAETKLSEATKSIEEKDKEIEEKDKTIATANEKIATLEKEPAPSTDADGAVQKGDTKGDVTVEGETNETPAMRKFREKAEADAKKR